MIDIKSEKCKSYLVRHLDGNNRTKSHDPDSWQDRGHTVTIIRGEIGPQDTHDFLFVDHMHIHRENWQWLHKRTELVWKQRERGEYSAGYIGFTDDGRVGGGSMQIGDGVEVEAVELQYLRPSYTMAVSRDAGAYVAGEHELTLKWDINSEQWKNATWDEEAMTFTYWQEQWGNIGDDVIWQTATVFNDNTNNTEWDVQPRGPSGTGAATSHIDRYGQFVFSLNDFYDPPDMDVDKNLFPYKMVFEFDELAQNILGGAMLCRERSLKGDVYALTGKPQNHFVAGTYKLNRPGHFGTILTTHRQKLVIDGKHVEKSGIYHNKLWWEDLSAAQCKMSDLPPRGFVEFSADGSIVTHSSFGVEGYRAPAILEAEPTLSIYDLINMNPYKETSEGVVDSIQQSSMEGFYKILQYYMPKEDLNHFIAPYPPDLGDIEDIAKDDAANEEWYSQLSVPYLVNALKSADNENVKYLNARRAQAVMKEFTGTSEVYAQQTKKLYSHEWQKRFPNMVKFIADQAKNTEHQRRYIIESSAEWIKDIEEGISETTIEEEREDLKRMTSIAENIRERGLQGQYWSYILFKYLSSPQYLSMLRMMMTQGNTSSQQLTQNIQRYSSLLSILDSSGFFMKEFVEVMQIFQLTSLLPSFIDVANDWEEISMFVPMVTNAFIEKYINSTDPQMKDYARDMQEELAKNRLQDYMKILYSVGATVGSSSWVNVSREFTRKAVDKFGKGAAIVGNFMLFANAGMSIYQLSTGMVSFRDMTPAEQADFIVMNIKLSTLLIRKGIMGIYAFKTGESFWVCAKALVKDVQLTATSTTSTFGRWIMRNVSTPATSVPAEAELAMQMLTEDFVFEVQYPRLCKIFGRNLTEFMSTRFAALLGVGGIILSSVALAESHEGMVIAMNSLFLVSSVLNLVSVIAGWAVTTGVTTVGGFGLASICSVTSGLSIFGAIVGVILMIVYMFTHKQPPDPVTEFINSDKVNKGGFFMGYSGEVDYFQVIKDEDDKPRSLGLSMTPDTADNEECLTILPDGNIKIGPLSHGYDTVLSVSTDYKGHSMFSSRVFPEDNNDSLGKVLVLTLEANNRVMMKSPEVDQEKRKQQQWIVTCVGDVTFDSKDHLQSGPFTIENVRGRGVFLDSNGSSIIGTPMKRTWTLSMQGMKPEMLSFPDINLSIYDRDRVFYPSLGQVGSVSGQEWMVEPSLPPFLELDVSKGLIRQKAGVEPSEFDARGVKITVRNEYGSARAEFDIHVTEETM